MAFDNLSSRLQDALAKLRGKGKVNEKDVEEVMREVRLALLEADVNFKVVKEFINNVKSRCIGVEVMESLTPGQQVIKIVNDELTALMGSSEEKIQFSSKPPTVIMMCGLQGAGKTTTSAKIAMLLKKQNKRPLLVACDVYRPAAIKQLQVVGEKVDVPVFTMGDKISPIDIAKAGLEYAIKNNRDVVFIDTAGRLHIDEPLMEELKAIYRAVNPTEVLLVLDSMTGQDAVNVAKSFDEQISLTGVVLTKLDGDARGGAALSIRAVTKKPIKFVAVGEKMDQIEVFHPDRMASRILGMGDVLSLIEKAQINYDEKKAREMERKMREASFTFEDYLDQLNQMKKMGPLDELLKMIPGFNNKALSGIKVNDRDIARIEAIIRSMTLKERLNPDIIDSSRRKRIADGSGSTVSEVNRLLKQFKEMKKMMKRFTSLDKRGFKKKRGFGFPFM